MSKEYSNEEFGFGSSAYGEPTPQKQEEKIAKSASTPAKIQRAAVTAVAPAVEAASASAPEAVAPPLPPLPTASAGAPPAVQNPVQTADFWSSALKGVGIPVGLGLAAGAAGGLLARRSGRGGSPAGSVAPTVDEDLRQLRLAQEQAKLDAIYEKNYRQQQLHEANLAKMQPKPSAATPTVQAGMPSTSQQFSVQQTPVDYSLTPAKAYGQQSLNVPTGAPNVAVAPPAEMAPTAVEPKPMSEIERLRVEKAQFDLEAARAKEARAAELHANRLAADAKRAEASNQKRQGQVKSNISAQDQSILADNAEAKARAAVVASGQPKPPTASPIGGTAMPIQGAATPPAGTPPPKAVTPSVATPELEAKLGAPTATTGSGMPAYQGEGGDKAKMRKEFSTIKDVPSGYVFVPNGQNMDIVRNAVGQEQYTGKLKESGGLPTSTEQAYQQSRDINKAAGRPSREEAKAKGLPLGETTKGITKAVAGSKTVRVAGVTGALVLASDLALAAEEGVSSAKKGDTQMARGYATDIIGALTGPLGMIASQTFGTSPEDLRVLRAADQGRKVGAGRGIAPPAAYQR